MERQLGFSALRQGHHCAAGPSVGACFFRTIFCAFAPYPADAPPALAGKTNQRIGARSKRMSRICVSNLPQALARHGRLAAGGKSPQAHQKND